MAVKEIAQIQLRRNPENTLPGAPSSLSPLAFSAGLAEGELFFSTDTGRIFIGDTPQAGQINYNRASLPYQSLEVLTENSVDIIRTAMLGASRDYGSEGFYSATLSPNSNPVAVLIDLPNSNSAPYEFDGAKMHVRIEYFLFAEDGSPLTQGELRAATVYASDQAVVVQNTLLQSPVVAPINNDDAVVFSLQKISANSAYSFSLQYTSSFADPVKMLFRVCQPGNIFVPEIGYVTDAYLANGTDIGADIRYDGISAIFTPISANLGGTTSLIGPTGPAGGLGPTGPSGATGVTGPRGFGGLNGAIGATGPTGNDGPLGQTGPTGATGAPGQVGPQGVQDKQERPARRAGRVWSVRPAHRLTGLPWLSGTGGRGRCCWTRWASRCGGHRRSNRTTGQQGCCGRSRPDGKPRRGRLDRPYGTDRANGSPGSARPDRADRSWRELHRGEAALRGVQRRPLAGRYQRG